MKRTITLILATLTTLYLMATPALAGGIIGGKPSGVIGTKPVVIGTKPTGGVIGGKPTGVIGTKPGGIIIGRPVNQILSD